MSAAQEHFTPLDRRQAPNGKWYLSPQDYKKKLGISERTRYYWRDHGIHTLDGEKPDTHPFQGGNGREMDYYSEEQADRILEARRAMARPLPIIDSRFKLFAIRTGVYPSAQDARLFVPAPGMWALHNAAPLTKGRLGLRRRALEACGRKWPVIKHWLGRYKMLEWFHAWLLSGQEAPEGIRIVTDLQAGRCRKAWDYIRFFHEIDGKTNRTRVAYYDWVSEKGLGSLAWRVWLYGGPVPAGGLVVSEALQRLRHERTQQAICEAAGINYETYRKGKREPHIAEAFKAAYENASAAGRPSREGIGNGLQASVLKWIWAYAESAREAKCLERAGICNSAYNNALRDAERIGVKDTLIDFLQGGEDW